MVGSKPSSLRYLTGSSEQGPQQAWRSSGVLGAVPEGTLFSASFAMSLPRSAVS
jgi:hypothetical protein